jgi:hypothetical protein
MEAWKFFLGEKPASFNLPESTESKVAGGPLEESNPMTAKINAETYIGSNEPLSFVRHGSADEAILFLQSIDLAETLRAKGNKVDFALVPGARHGILGMNFFRVFDAEEMYNWLSQQIYVCQELSLDCELQFSCASLERQSIGGPLRLRISFADRSDRISRCGHVRERACRHDTRAGWPPNLARCWS